MKVKIETPITANWLRAVERAAADRKAGRMPTRIGCKTYRVPSSTTAAAHIVTITSLVKLLATCDCTAGQRGLACRHAAAALCEAARYIAQQQPVAAAPVAAERTYGPNHMTAAEVDRKMARFARL
jgi:hypothetical protein